MFTVKAFKPFEILKIEYATLEEAETKFDALRLDPAYDACYIFENDRLVFSYSEYYDSPKGFDEYPLGELRDSMSYSYLKDHYPPYRIVMWNSDTKSYDMLNTQGNIDYRTKNLCIFSVHHVDDEGHHNPVMITGQMDYDTAYHLHYLYNRIHDISRVAVAIQQAMLANDNVFSKQMIDDLICYIKDINITLQDN
jgi:hypothetical protein